MWVPHPLYFLVSPFSFENTSLPIFSCESLSFKTMFFQFPWSCYSRRTSCLISSFGRILQSRSRASIWNSSPSFLRVVSTWLSRFFRAAALRAGIFLLLHLLFVLLIIDCLEIPPLGVSKIPLWLSHCEFHYNG